MEMKKVFLGEAVVNYVSAENPVDNQIRSSRDAYNNLRDMIGTEMNLRELVCVLYMNQKSSVLWSEIIHIGGATQSIVDVKQIIKRALVGGVESIIIGHNHPSGNKSPSHSDRIITKKLYDACMLMDIRLFDHIILTNDTYYSFADNGERSIS